ncbi:hypothetical protein GCM10027451_37520 [Geodermatophilus aquaeductus]
MNRFASVPTARDRVVMTTIDVNGTTLYYERRGEGPSVLFIAGATGDAGHFRGVAEALADEFTVVTFDRRGTRGVQASRTRAGSPAAGSCVCVRLPTMCPLVGRPGTRGGCRDSPSSLEMLISLA